jgi:hypothetical protein
LKLFLNEETMEVESINTETEKPENKRCEENPKKHEIEKAAIKLQKLKIKIYKPKFAQKVLDDGLLKHKEEEKTKDESSVGTNYWWYLGILAIPILLLGNLSG